MTDYALTAGPLSTFDFLYDPRLDRIKDMRDFHTMEITEKTLSDRKFADLRRDALREITFISTLVASVSGGHAVMCGFRDITSSHAFELARTLKSQSKVRWISMKCGAADDELVLFESKDFKTDLALLQKHYPPAEGEVFFYLTKQIFDIYEVYWRRKAADSQRAKEEHFRRDVIACGHESQMTLFVDHEGAFTVMTQPAFMDDTTAQKRVMDAGKRALMNITIAPSLFG